MYALFVILGITSAFSGVPTLSLAAPEWYMPVFSWAIILSSAAAMVSSLQPKWECFERWPAVILTGTLASYWFAAFTLYITGDWNRGAFSVLLFIATLLVGARVSDLFETHRLIKAFGVKLSRVFKRGKK